MALGITLEKAIKVFSKELGCPGDYEQSREYLLDEIQTAIEYMLLNGGGEILREWIVTVRSGRFTLPRDLETPVRYKFGRTANYGYGTFNSVYYPYSSQSITSCCGYHSWNNRNIAITPNRVATQFRPPKKGVFLVATTRDERDIGKKIMVNGNRCKNPNLPTHFNHKTSGELLTIYAEDDPNKKYGTWLFDDITGVVKDETCGYVMLSGIDSCSKEWFFLSHYTPDETIPQYTECELYNCACSSCDCEMHVLGRISPNIKYIRDEDVLPISSLEMLRMLAKRARYDESSEYNELQVMENRIRNLIIKQVAYQRGVSRQLSVSLPTSGASLTHL